MTGGALTADQLSKLRTVCRSVTDDAAELALYGFDATGLNHPPNCVAFPITTEEVSGIMRYCHQQKIAVTPRGAGTGQAGGSVPITGGLLLCLARMNKITNLNADAMYVEVEPGVINGELSDFLAEEKLFYPPDPASLKTSTIGGNVATSAGGPSAVKYGVTSDYVMGLTAVLPNGEVIKTGIKTAKGVVGYDLTSLLVGSEGTLAVITNIRLKLLPLPAKIFTATAIFSSREKAIAAVSAILRAGLKPRTAEYIDSTALNAVCRYLKESVPDGAAACLLLETDGEEASAKKEMAGVEDICRQFSALQFNLANSEAEREAEWRLRRSISPALRSISPSKINEDVTVPINRIAELMQRLDELSSRVGLPIVNFGHAGDGNIHVNLMTDKKNEQQYAKALQAVEEVFDITLELDGTISGEHGVGLAKKRYIRKELGQTCVAISKEVKKAFDPHNILNPEKLFP